ncbi:SDR family NAD(P)-dependent oxidoreductase [Pseudonocardia sp. HH130630-07]|uniref:SDR family NAD(P)-dependent oxidoreductase n=1 Tax=Pseudonocardia sp. HH130630-07 TaxID=1690815 RepID=UPI000814D964|nr:SDR family NAD(P)-dependent oxidoreductase [Pseudonocardia sp. HH130630-07]ANY06338.1 alcohol dehydrogenase [Pseudonocardia sp. HH130630-07]
MTWNPAHLPDLTGRTFAVTGATAGIGYFAAEQLSGAGAHVVLIGRNPAKLGHAMAALAVHAPQGTNEEITLDLADLDSVRRGAGRLAALPRLDGLLLNGGSMDMGRAGRATTADGHPMLLGTHLLSALVLTAGALPRLTATGTPEDAARVVFTSTGFVRLFRQRLNDVAAVPRLAVNAYTKAKALTEVVARELDRRLRERELPVRALLSRPGVGVDARTPRRTGIHDATTRSQPNPMTPWAQGKDTAAWSAVRALTDPDARGGDYLAPTGALRGRPEPDTNPPPSTVALGPAERIRIWDDLHRLAGVPQPV